MTECNRCGDCCDPVVLGPDAEALLDAYLTTGGATPARPVKDGEFFLTHWTKLPTRSSKGNAQYVCSAFDQATRECTAHEDRPHVCRGYPWYGKEPTLERGLSPRCSFLADVVDLPMPAVRAS